jgi:hypothetical protein
VTDDEAAEKMKALPGNCEDGHYDGDYLLCELLRETYPKTVAAWEAHDSEWWWA